jgi:2,3-bisphosphoglycerate-dependent phosphoglycerate mutase
MGIPVQTAWELNERHYGALQGLDKQVYLPLRVLMKLNYNMLTCTKHSIVIYFSKATVDKYGADQVKIWRRSYDIPPPPCDLTSQYNAANDPKYAHVNKNLLPLTESLKVEIKNRL